MFVKICGIRSESDARAASEAGADAVGLNFFPGSKRFVLPEVATEITASLAKHVAAVALFVNQPVADIAAIAGRCGIRLVQPHGDETPDGLARISDAAADVEFIRVFRDVARVERDLERCATLGLRIRFCLIDANTPGGFGGSGQVADWQSIASDYEYGTWPPLMLAGGLTPKNVQSAIAATRPAAVDVASGVESAAGYKDATAMRAFVANAKSA